MKLLHTADWHVGRTLRGRSRADEHRAALAEIARHAREEDVDLILVAGDLFDSAAPTPEAEEIVYRALLDLAGTGAEIVLVAGNHDSAQRLAAIRPLLALTRIHTVAYPLPPAEGGVLDLRTRDGATARLALLPFLSQRGIVRADQLMAGDAGDHVQAYADRVRRLFAALCSSFDDGFVNVVVSHLTVVNGVMGGGERQAHTVFDYHVPAQVFPPAAHYVALGHLHRCQQIAGAAPIWYSGAPLQLDFGEAEGGQSVLIVEAEPGIPARVRPIPLRSGRPLRTLRGTLPQLEALRDEAGDAFLRVVVREAPRAGLADSIRELFPLAVDVAIDHQSGDEREGEPWTADQLRRSPAELFAEYLQDNRIVDPAVLALFAELLEEAHVVAE